MRKMHNCRIGRLLLAFVMVLSLCGCGAKGTLTLAEAGSGISLVNEKMAAYMDAEASRVLSYASGTAEKSYPNAVFLSWTLEGAEADFYRVRVSESQDLGAAWVLEVTEPALELYNCKTGATYYWSVAAVKGRRKWLSVQRGPSPPLTRRRAPSTVTVWPICAIWAVGRPRAARR